MTEAECWVCIADACAEHDAEHYARALAALDLLTQWRAHDVEDVEAGR